ncbi:MAG TPA: RIP metalloprotease RseP [Candidatus Paceibacterota bacterium]
MSIILFIVILGVLVFVHELGHFLVAKRFGIRVDEFAIGFPPRVVSRKVGETEYSLNLVPIGGYVKIFGEDILSPAPDDSDRSRSFVAKNRAIQASVLLAGVFANVLFAWMLLSAVFMIGATVSKEQYASVVLTDERLLVVAVLDQSPAARAGIKSGDVIRYIRAESGGLSAPTIDEVQRFIGEREGNELVLGVERKSEKREVHMTPVSGIIQDTVGIGISMDTVGTLRLSFFRALAEGTRRTSDLFIATVQGLWDFLYRIVSFNADFSTVAGPVGIAVLVSDAQTLGWFYLVSFTAIISLNLAVINLIPFPALDGGRLFFVIIEAIIRRPLPQRLVRVLNTTGFMLLLVLLVFVTYKDILRLL